jgi:outer membrane receptor protein involved in Fe transport
LRPSAISLAILLALGPAAAPMAEAADAQLRPVTVTGTRELQPIRELAGNTSRIEHPAIERTRHTHVSELLYRAPGTWISRGSGQEHLTAIRSPVLTGAGACGGFLFLEDGIPTRPAGFCNVNGLFEINTEQADAIEVVRGPGSALYGSNAMHGSINVLGRVPGPPVTDVAFETGSWDYYRGRFLFGTDEGDASLMAWGHAEQDGGFRDHAGYDQAKVNMSWEAPARDGVLRISAAGTYLRQDTAGFIFGEDAYKDGDQRRSNLFPDAYRDADSLRVTAGYRRDLDADSRVDARFYYRYSSMEFLQHFIPGTPVEKNGQDSAGTQINLRRKDRRGGEWIFGTDAEFMDGFLEETQAEPITEGSDFLRETRPAGKHYDYDVQAWQAAGYVHHQRPLGERCLLTAGLRYEYLRYDYDNRMLDGNTRDDGTECGFGGCLFNRPPDRDDDFHGLAPKLGFVALLGPRSEAYVNLTRGFRFPQATELYRLQRQQSVADLDPETLDSAEIGLRTGRGGVAMELGGFYMEKNNAIFRDAQGINVSDGETRHVGLEYQLDWQITNSLTLGLAGTWARHTYRFDRAVSGGETISSGDDVDTAPRHINNVTLRWQYASAGIAELEWLSLGSYYMDAANTAKYGGHDVVNLRLNQDLGGNWSSGLRVTNLLEESYAERADLAFGRYRYLPGRDRAVFVEIRYRSD